MSETRRWRVARAAACGWLLACSAWRVGAQATEAPVARDLSEETQHISVTVKDRFGRQETVRIPVTVFRPKGEGPYPLVIMNHGRAPAEKRATQTRQRFEYLSRYFVDKGFVVLLPTRVGYAETFGEFDPEGTDACRRRDFDPVAAAIGTEEDATLAFAKTLPYVDASHWVVAGVSVGGLATGIVAARRPVGLIGAINFSGGMGGDPDAHPGQPCDPAGLARFWSRLAATAHVPTLWLYWDNDRYWGAAAPAQWRDAWVGSGGQAEFHALPAVGKDGHAGVNIDMNHWVPLVDAFIGKLGLALTATSPPHPPSSGYAAIAETSKVPIEPAARKHGYAKFIAAPSPRAFAIGPRGAWGWSTGDWAIGRALGNCARAGEPCKLYAIDDEVVWAP